jgi:CRP/FNR family transcriptional regulator
MTASELAEALSGEPGVRPVAMAAGASLFRPGDACRDFVLLRAGRLRVTLTSEGGRELVLYRVGPGDICLQTFSCLTQGRSYAAEGLAETDLEGLAIPHSVFNRLLGENPDFRAHLLSAIARRFDHYGELVETLAFAGLAQRLARALLRLSPKGEMITATHEALAAEAASAREAVSRQLARFARDGWLTLGRGHIMLTNRDALSRAAEG